MSNQAAREANVYIIVQSPGCKIKCKHQTKLLKIPGMWLLGDEWKKIDESWTPMHLNTYILSCLYVSVCVMSPRSVPNCWAISHLHISCLILAVGSCCFRMRSSSAATELTNLHREGTRGISRRRSSDKEAREHKAEWARDSTSTPVS